MPETGGKECELLPYTHENAPLCGNFASPEPNSVSFRWEKGKEFREECVLCCAILSQIS